MKVEQLFIAGLGAFLPPPVSVREAVADGRYDAQEAEETQLESVLVAGHESPPDMAVQAARGALAYSGLDPEEIKLVLHASIYFQGLDLYSTASYTHGLNFQGTVLGQPAPPGQTAPVRPLSVGVMCGWRRSGWVGAPWSMTTGMGGRASPLPGTDCLTHLGREGGLDRAGPRDGHPSELLGGRHLRSRLRHRHQERERLQRRLEPQRAGQTMKFGYKLALHSETNL